ELRYYFRSFQKFDLFEVFQEASALCNPLEIHPAISCEKNEKGRFFELTGEKVRMIHVKPSDNGDGIIFRLMSMNDQPQSSELSFGDRIIKSATLCAPHENKIRPLEIKDNKVILELQPMQITTVKVIH
ncbi:hypothetical protein GF337_07735, partial [candidate division KSB1 bacterium]|nr:hypothetical protein [candidate division KSB1 bacterium]